MSTGARQNALSGIMPKINAQESVIIDGLPVNAKIGQMVYLTTDDTYYVYTDTLGWVTFGSSGSGFTLPAALESIANLTTLGDEIIYTVATNTYDTSSISAAGRSFVSITTQEGQQAALGLVPGTNIQAHSNILDSLNSIAAASNRLPYTIGGVYAATTLDSWARLNLLTATSASDINTLLNTITGAGIVLPGAVTDVLRYYIRARVTAAGAGGGSDEITTVPVIEQIKLHSNRTEINKDGFIEMFGNARVRSSIPISNSSFYPTGIAGETAPSSQQLTFSTSSTNIEAIIPNSLFAFRWKPLENIDIAEICYVDVNFSRSTAGTGNVVLQLDYVFISNNDVIGDPNGTPNATSSSTGP